MAQHINGAQLSMHSVKQVGIKVDVSQGHPGPESNHNFANKLFDEFADYCSEALLSPKKRTHKLDILNPVAAVDTRSRPIQYPSDTKRTLLIVGKSTSIPLPENMAITLKRLVNRNVIFRSCIGSIHQVYRITMRAIAEFQPSAVFIFLSDRYVAEHYCRDSQIAIGLPPVFLISPKKRRLVAEYLDYVTVELLTIEILRGLALLQESLRNWGGEYKIVVPFGFKSIICNDSKSPVQRSYCEMIDKSSIEFSTASHVKRKTIEQRLINAKQLMNSRIHKLFTPIARERQKTNNNDHNIYPLW